MNQQRQRFRRYRWTIVGVVVLSIAILCFGTACVGVSHWVWMSRCREIELGATKGKVRILLGDPDRVVSLLEWQYTTYGGLGWVEIWFDEKGGVRAVNTESPFP